MFWTSYFCEECGFRNDHHKSRTCDFMRGQIAMTMRNCFKAHLDLHPIESHIFLLPNTSLVPVRENNNLCFTIPDLNKKQILRSLVRFNQVSWRNNHTIEEDKVILFDSESPNSSDEIILTLSHIKE